MNDRDEIAQTLDVIGRRWGKTTFSADELDRWTSTLYGLDADRVLDAVEHLKADGRRGMPTPELFADAYRKVASGGHGKGSPPAKAKPFTAPTYPKLDYGSIATAHMDRIRAGVAPTEAELFDAGVFVDEHGRLAPLEQFTPGGLDF